MEIYIDWSRDPETLARILKEGLLAQPLHVQKDAGVIEVANGWELPNDKQISLQQIPQFIGHGGLLWSGIELAARIGIMTSISVAPRFALKPDIMDVIFWMPAVKLWLADWQRLVNSGTCWLISGRFGKLADDLLDAGALLRAVAPITGHYGQVYPARDQVEDDKPGSPAFVKAHMGEPYYEWISSIIEEKKPG